MPGTNPFMWLGTAILASAPIYLVLQIVLVVLWRGRWRIAALVPLIVILPALAMTAYEALHGSNLAPLPFIAAAPAALIYLVIAGIIHEVRRPRSA
jgi:hypothetical protein